MADLPLALALSAGMLAAVNPCGFALLPAYLSLLVLGEDSPGRLAAVGRALAATAAMTLGFAAVFGLFGLAVSPVAGQVQEHLPWFTVVFGLLLAAVGGWLLAGRELPAVLLPKLRRAPRVSRSLLSMALFGGAYAIASLGCTIAPFLAIVVSAFRSGSTGEGVVLFAAYAAGMGVVVGAAALAVALTRTSAVGRMRRFGAVATRLGGALLLLAGAYVAYYGWYEIRGAVSDPVVEAAGTGQRWLADGLDAAGVPVVAAVFALLLAAAFALHRRAAVRARPPEAPAYADAVAKRDLAVFDLDGTLTDTRHRLHYVESAPKDWEGFFRAADDDPPLAEGVELALRWAGECEVGYVTGRPEYCRRATEKWLADHGLPDGPLWMRKAGDRRPARVAKAGLLRGLAKGRTVAVVVDDDEQVCLAYEKAGFRVVRADWMPPAETLRRAQEDEGRT